MACKSTVIRVKQGQLRGVVTENVYGGDEYLAFYGIPYAKPPVGPLRFEDPQPVEPWTGIKDASNFGDVCAQFDILSRRCIGSDDCLYLNVYTPTSDAPEKGAVMVWFHGGAFMHGSGTNIYGADYLIRKDIILVTINYRVGVLGFLNLEHEVATGNQGLKDQVMALKWVQENIAQFGGDPNNVTIFGESAGGGSVHYLTLSPLAQGLFHKAIAQSGVATNPWAIMNKTPSKYVYQMAAKLGENSTDPKTVLEFLRTVDAQKLVSIEAGLLSPLERHITFGVVGPGIDDKSSNPFMPEHPSLMMKKGVQVPFLLGYNENEGSMLLNLFNKDYTKEKLQAVNANFEVVIPAETLVNLKKEGISPQEVKRIYFGDKLISEETMQQYADYMSDVMFLQGIHDVVKMQLEKSTNPTYFYKFTFDAMSVWKTILNINLPGATHADELQYLFHPRVSDIVIDPPEVGTDKYTIMQILTQMWSDFAKTGNPTPKTSELIPTIWKPIEKSDSYNYMNINTTPKMETSSKKSQRFDWKAMKHKL